MSLLIDQISYLSVFLLLILNKLMLAVFNAFIDSSDASTSGILEKKCFIKNSCFLKNNFLVGCISKILKAKAGPL